MNEYKTRPSQEQHYHHTSESTSMATVYETTATAELPYHSSGTYNVLQPYGSYSSHLPPYFEPQASMGLQSPDMNTVPSLRHDQHLSQHHHHYRQGGYSGYPVEMSSTRSASIRGIPEHEIESQDSINEQTMSSERINPPLEGFPQVEEFDRLMESYVNELSVKKQDKALINAQRAQQIRIVLTDPKDTSVGSAQFRFWVKKMFKLEPADSRLPTNRKWICHEGKPVAIREKLFKILTRAHQQCQHGGRDKTSAQVRQIYSWVPKELISRFVKICPTCQVRRGGSHLSPPDSRRNSPPMELSRGQPPQSPVAYMRAQPVPPMAYDEYRRNSSSSSSYGYSDSRNREWGAYLSPTSRHSETAWSPPPSHHQHHHHHGGRQDTATSSPPSRSMAGENSTSQAQYLSGYVGTHSNSRYRPGY
uniref:Nucleolar protein 4 n=1 Tax=Talaromyces marneffei PM1 TaxID=1077442 RepID=A0A093XPK4_TALMA